MVRGRASVLVLVTATAVASAQANPQGAKLFEEGRTLAKAGKYAEACAKFAASLEIDPAIGTQLNYADCHEKQGHNAEAWRLFDGAADAEKITNPERAKFARSRADALLPKLGVIVLKLATPDAPMLAVSINKRTLKAAPVIKEIVEPGEAAITVTAQGAAPFQATPKVEPGSTQEITVPAFGSAAIDTPVSGPETHTKLRRKRSRVLLGYGLGGGGVVALGASVFIAMKAKSDYDKQESNGNCVDGTCNGEGFKAQNDAISLANVGTVIGIGGLALIGAGVAVILTAPTEGVVVAPTATASSAGISVVGRF
jgi:tetratricopeptide (TPR) repeat protein